MATLESLKNALRQAAPVAPKQALSNEQYSAGFNILVANLGWKAYQDFIIPQLSQLLTTYFSSRWDLSVLDIGPGPNSVFGHLPSGLKRKVSKYTAFEPNILFAAKLEERLRFNSQTDPSLPYLDTPAHIYTQPFTLQDKVENATDKTRHKSCKKYDLILFCHSMYGMKPKHIFIERALQQINDHGIVVVFHRNTTLALNGLVCYQTASFPTGIVRIPDNDEVIDRFASFIAGFSVQDGDIDEAVRVNWRKWCRTLGRSEESHPNHLVFSAPDTMLAFTQQADTLSKLTTQVPSANTDITIKNQRAMLNHPTSIVRPTQVRQVQQCVRWALEHKTSLTVIGGGHSSQCVWPNVVAIDMSAFGQICIVGDDQVEGSSTPLVVVEAGCKTGEIISKTMAAGITVPLGARPSVGAGLWLQGGIGHLARQHGLACDSIIGAIVVSVESGDVLCLGHVPSQHQPEGATRPENEHDYLWAMRGAGTNFGIVVSVTFKSYAAATYLVRNWIIPLRNSLEAHNKLKNFATLVAKKLPRNRSSDAYLYWESGQRRLGVTMFEDSSEAPSSPAFIPAVDEILGQQSSSKVMDGIGLFEAEMYVSEMHGGHSGGKTSSFKRCIFLKDIEEAGVAARLIAAVENRPSPLCYLHLLHGGEAIQEVAPTATAFGCRDWDFACVITGVWPRDRDGTEAERSAIQWVYNVAGELLPLCTGAYGADLGPDDRDAVLAAKAFGPSRARLSHLKDSLDPQNVLPYACPLRGSSTEQRLIILLTGESYAGKDYCAEALVSVFSQRNFTAYAVSISDATKREYAAFSGADLDRLLSDRAYKERHRPALTAFFQEQVEKRPRLLEDRFLDVVYSASYADVLLISGMRDEAPVAAFSHLVPSSRVIEVYIRASQQTRQIRRKLHGCDDDIDDKKVTGRLNATNLTYRPTLFFDNDATGNGALSNFAEQHLLPLLHENLQQLTAMVRSRADFPRPGLYFRHVLGIPQQAGGLTLCTSLLKTHFAGDWTKVNAIVSCESGGFIYASALAVQAAVPLVLIRKAGKLPPPTLSVSKTLSYISSLAPTGSEQANNHQETWEMERDSISSGASVVVVDDVLSTGKTLFAVLQLLIQAGVAVENISVLVVAEFPVHRGRDFLRCNGFGQIRIQNLLVFNGH